MGEFSMQMFYLFVYVLVLCDGLPVITEESNNQSVHYEDNTSRDGTLHNVTVEILNSQKEISTVDFQVPEKQASPYLYNISRYLVDKVHAFTGNLINFIRSSVMARSTLKDEPTIAIMNKEDTNKSESNETSLTELTEDLKSLKKYQFNSSEQFTSSLARYLNRKIHDRSKTDRHLRGHRKYRQKRSFFFDYGFGGLESAFEDDSTDLIFGAHTSPCPAADRHYCLNGGTCVYLEALDIKTCRCSIGYTGLRCEMMNQEYILALLSAEFFG